jgi:hypothetical protein
MTTPTSPGTSTGAPGGETTLLSPGEADNDAVFVTASDDKSVVVIVSDEQVTDEDDGAREPHRRVSVPRG